MDGSPDPTRSKVEAAAHLVCLLSLATLLACGGTTPARDASLHSSTSHEEKHQHSERHEHAQAGEHTQRSHSFQDPERYVADWNDPARDEWQKPEEIIAALELEPGATVVDLGAGTGYLLPRLSSAVGPSGTVIAVDIEPAMLSFIDKAAQEQGWGNVRTHQSSANALRLPAASLDGIVTVNTWHHIEQRVSYARHLLEVLRPRGRFVVVDFVAEQTDGSGPPLAMRLSADQVLTELTAAGFEAEALPETMPRHYVVRGRVPE